MEVRQSEATWTAMTSKTATKVTGHLLLPLHGSEQMTFGDEVART